MPYTALFIAHAPDADPERHRSVVDTGIYRLFTVVVRDHEPALALCSQMGAEERVGSVLLCPGNSNEDVGEIAAAMEKASWFGAQPRT
jgi:hypothetical protein